jgi:hypothetical protein
MAVYLEIRHTTTYKYASPVTFGRELGILELRPCFHDTAEIVSAQHQSGMGIVFEVDVAHEARMLRPPRALKACLLGVR